MAGVASTEGIGSSQSNSAISIGISSMIIPHDSSKLRKVATSPATTRVMTTPAPAPAPGPAPADDALPLALPAEWPPLPALVLLLLERRSTPEPAAGPRHAVIRRMYASFFNGISKLISNLANNGCSPSCWTDGKLASVDTNTCDRNILPPPSLPPPSFPAPSPAGCPPARGPLPASAAEEVEEEEAGGPKEDGAKDEGVSACQCARARRTTERRKESRMAARSFSP
eukprot:TRINITY_DN3918_c0_g2_i2.p1 TRINITY_DN3918_c0_g2~~TRINITY_DN3918_c0_g2_i2.p1  ORF type:complete len:227 (-),score=44.55 TRINITY_DN3918_c0_g2_i2:531-1211(-)